MKTIHALVTVAALAMLSGTAWAIGDSPAAPVGPVGQVGEDDKEHDARMAWWRDAKFGMFIHWGLYSIPAGEWPGKGNQHAEWIRESAQIPVDEYEKLLPKFNPVKFNADQWAAMAQDAGMRYLVITSKHHDGFCLFDTAQTDWDVMSTPFKRDIMKELSDACKKLPTGADKRAVRFCMYHSIMDWHHPDYMPRRAWEKASRPGDKADFEKFVAYLKAELAELCSPKYDPGLIWFDGEWEGTWTADRGRDLFEYMRKIAPKVIVNNRIDKGRAGMDGETGKGYLGDYHTPEQTIPAAGLPGDWETCMTMNGNWGYNAADKNFKSTRDLIEKLCDIASKGGNFLLNVGPTAEGEIPAESIQRLKEIGAWMRINGDAIYGTTRSPLAAAPAWGRITVKHATFESKGATELYLHIFEMPKDGKLSLPGIMNQPVAAAALQDPKGAGGAVVGFEQVGGQIDLDVSKIKAADPVTVVKVTVLGTPDVSLPPVIEAFADEFVTSVDVKIGNPMKNVEVRYSGDGKDPTPESRLYDAPFAITKAMTIAARGYRDGKPVTPVVRRTFVKAPPRASVVLEKTEPGLKFACYLGTWDKLPDFASLKPAKESVVQAISIKEACSDDGFGLRFTGYISVPKTDVYTFHLSSDDGSRMLLGSGVLIDNDGLHSLEEKSATIVLAGGWHPITIEMFERSGGSDLGLTISSPGAPRKAIEASQLVHDPAGK